MTLHSYAGRCCTTPVAMCLATLMGTLATMPAHAALPSGNLGLTSFNDGKSKPGDLFQQFVNVYEADRFMDAHGRPRPVDNELQTLVLATFVGRITEHKVFGAWYGYEALQPIVLVDADYTPAVRAGNGLGNLSVSPVVLQWPEQTLFGRPYYQRLNLQVQLPTGSYRRDRAINPSSNAWAFNPHYALTWEFADNWELSSRIHYLWTGRNSDPNPAIAADYIQPGQALHANVSVSRAVGQHWRLGVSGYALKQISAERIDGRTRADSMERVSALGPAVQFGTGRTRIMFHYYKEFDAANRSEGDRVLVRWFQLF
ncbi:MULTISPECIES: SphA family protein [Stenotrophomonas]|nr:transporter [Stenotrophomonas maltophilia]